MPCFRLEQRVAVLECDVDLGMIESLSDFSGMKRKATHSIIHLGAAICMAYAAMP